MIMQCTPGATSMNEVLAKCEVRQSAAADATGSFSGFVSVKSSFRPMGGSETVDCTAAPGACAISTFDMVATVVDAVVAFTGDGAAWANAPIDLIYRRVLAMSSSPLIVSSQGRVEVPGAGTYFLRLVESGPISSGTGSP